MLQDELFFGSWGRCWDLHMGGDSVARFFCLCTFTTLDLVSSTVILDAWGAVVSQCRSAPTCPEAVEPTKGVGPLESS